VIGKVLCDHDFNTLTSESEFMTTMRKQLAWMPNTRSLNPFHHYNPLRPILSKYYKYKVDQYIGKVLDECFAVRDINLAKQKEEGKLAGIDVALKRYCKDAG
jgi:hypothetical protein